MNSSLFFPLFENPKINPEPKKQLKASQKQVLKKKGGGLQSMTEFNAEDI